MEIKIPIVIDDKALEEAIDKQIAELKREGDFVLVTRCKDCKHYKPQKTSAQYNCRTNYCNRVVTLKVQPDDFCGYAEQKEIEGE